MQNFKKFSKSRFSFNSRAITSRSALRLSLPSRPLAHLSSSLPSLPLARLSSSFPSSSFECKKLFYHTSKPMLLLQGQKTKHTRPDKKAKKAQKKLPAVKGTWFPKNWAVKSAWLSHVDPVEFPDDLEEAARFEYEEENDRRLQKGMPPLPAPVKPEEAPYIQALRKSSAKFERAATRERAPKYFHLPSWVQPKAPEKMWISEARLTEWEKIEKIGMAKSLRRALMPERERRSLERDVLEKKLLAKGK